MPDSRCSGCLIISVLLRSAARLPCRRRLLLCYQTVITQSCSEQVFHVLICTRATACLQELLVGE
jgi:hypothetical protein